MVPTPARLLEAWSQPSGGHRTVTVSWWPSSKIPQHWFVTCDLHSVWFCIVVAKCSEMGSVSVSIHQKIPTGCGAGRLMGSSQPRAWKSTWDFRFCAFQAAKGEICLFPEAFSVALREAMKEQLHAPLFQIFVKQRESTCKQELFSQQHLTLSGCGKRSE